MDLFAVDPDRSRRSNNAEGDWWDRLTADSPLWAPRGSHSCGCRADNKVSGSAGSDTAGSDTAGSDTAASDAAEGDAAEDGASAANGSGAGPCGSGAGRGRSSWVLVGSLRESAQALALAPLPDDADICLAEAEELLFARDRITCALADRVGRVHGAGQA
ncbi:hypothetical protein FLW16_34080, partial [Microbispora sp. KK1-11]